MNTLDLARKVRRHVVEMTHRANSSHIGSALSITDILAILYGQVLNVDPEQPKKAERDRFILSKGHAGAAVYAVLAELGFFDKSILDSYYQNGSVLSGHMSHINVPGVEFSTGSLGHGLPVGVGMAYEALISHKPHRVFVLMSDGECDEGSNWEAILFAGHHALNNLIAIVDYNKIQSLGAVNEVLDLEPFADKWRAFKWNVVEVDGHSHQDLQRVLSQKSSSGPTCVIAHTIKGKGVSFMQNQLIWHYRSPQGEDYEKALAELEGNQ